MPSMAGDSLLSYTMTVIYRPLTRPLVVHAAPQVIRTIDTENSWQSLALLLHDL